MDKVNRNNKDVEETHHHKNAFNRSDTLRRDSTFIDALQERHSAIKDNIKEMDESISFIDDKYEYINNNIERAIAYRGSMINKVKQLCKDIQTHRSDQLSALETIEKLQRDFILDDAKQEVIKNKFNEVFITALAANIHIGDIQSKFKEIKKKMLKNDPLQSSTPTGYASHILLLAIDSKKTKLEESVQEMQELRQKSQGIAEQIWSSGSNKYPNRYQEHQTIETTCDSYLSTYEKKNDKIINLNSNN